MDWRLFFQIIILTIIVIIGIALIITTVKGD